MTHDFNERLRFSHDQSGQPWWEEVYRKAFPNFATMADVRKDGWAQRGGVDRVVVLASGRTVTVDEKVREQDWSDILLERWSDRDNEEPGWVQKDLVCDYLAYAFLPSRRCYLLPFLDLRRAWRKHGRDWIARYPTIEAQNAGWVTESVAVPIPVLLNALRSGVLVEWSDPQAVAA